MTETTRIADQLKRAFYGNAWHGDSLYEILTGVTAAQAAARPIKNAHSIWELLLHISAWDAAVRKRMTGVAVQLSDAENFPPVSDTSDAAWGRTLEDVRRVHDELIAAVMHFPEADLMKPVPGKSGAHYNFSYMLDGLAQHELYHAGQIALLKKM
ncbi:MAG TPA: DinB family protein [Terriglobales bacterium]|nr:DinB family protein [Terriglobales bacterium]